MPGERIERIEEMRREIAAGEFETQERLEGTVERLRDVLGRSTAQETDDEERCPLCGLPTAPTDPCGCLA